MMVGKRGGNNVQRLLENRPISGRIQIRPAAGDLAPDLSDSLFNLAPGGGQPQWCQFQKC